MSGISISSREPVVLLFTQKSLSSSSTKMGSTRMESTGIAVKERVAIWNGPLRTVRYETTYLAEKISFFSNAYNVGVDCRNLVTYCDTLSIPKTRVPTKKEI